MAAKKSRLCWDTIDDLYTGSLNEWGAFRYLRLVLRRQRLLAQLAGHLARRRRLRGNNKKYLHETMLALQR